MKRPSFQFYPADWQNSLKLKACSYELKGFYIDLLCLLHQSPKYGYLTKEMEENLHQFLGKDRRSSARLLSEVRKKLLMNVDVDTGELFNERMVNDEHIRQVRSTAGALGGNPNLLNQNVKQTHKQNPTPSSSSSSSSTSKEINKEKILGFEKFWSLYPKKVAKQDAFKAFQKINPAKYEEIYSGVARAKDSADWSKDDGKFIPYPATWLNGVRWEDDLSPAAPRPKIGSLEYYNNPKKP